MAKYYFGNHKAVVYHSNYLIAEVISSFYTTHENNLRTPLSALKSVPLLSLFKQIRRLLQVLRNG